MADTIITQDSTDEQRRLANLKYVHAMDYHLEEMRAMMRATSALACDVSNELTDKDSGGDVDCFLTMFYIMRDRFDLMVEVSDKFCVRN